MESLEPRLLLAGAAPYGPFADPAASVPLVSAVVGRLAGQPNQPVVPGAQAAPGAGGSVWNTSPGVGPSSETMKAYVAAGVNLDASELAAALHSAENLPAAAQVQLVDSLTPDQALDLYRIPLDSGTRNLGVTLTAMAPSQTLPGQVWLVDNAGNVLALWHIPANTHSMSLNLHIPPQFTESSIVFGVSHGDAEPAGLAAATSFFEVFVAHEVAPAALSVLATQPILVALPGASILPGMGGVIGVGATATAANSTTASASVAGAGDPGAQAVVGLVPAQLAIGPLPARSAAPFGGTLADGDPVPPVDQLDELMVDVNLLDLLPPRVLGIGRPVSAAYSALEPAQSGPATVAPLVSLEGSGGFPLLAASLGEGPGSQRPEATSPLELEAMLSTLPLVEPVAEACGTHEVCRTNLQGIGRLAERDAEEPEAQRASRKRGRVVVGLNVAATLAFGLLLPDLVAALQQIEPRRPLPPILRKRAKASGSEDD